MRLGEMPDQIEMSTVQERLSSLAVPDFETTKCSLSVGKRQWTSVPGSLPHCQGIWVPFMALSQLKRGLPSPTEAQGPFCGKLS